MFDPSGLTSRLHGAAAIGIAVLLCAAPTHAAFEDEPLDFELRGYWKVRALHIGNLFMGQGDTGDIGRGLFDEAEGRLRGLNSTAYLLHQMRLSPSIAYRKIAVLKLDVDVLDGVVWGDNAAVSSLALFAGHPSATGVDGDPLDTIAVRRAWLEVSLPVGSLRVGRMPSHWGMGLLANKGDGLDADFGDFKAGSTVDRILFATKPVQIVQTLMGVTRPEKGIGGKIILALAFDKMVDLARKQDEELGELACVDCPPQILLSRPNDDVDEYVGVLVYKDEKADIFGDTDLIQAGAYVVHRVQKDTQSKIWIIDGHLKLRLGQYGLESELLFITGSTNAIDSPEAPLNINIKGGVARVGYYDFLDQLDFELELGWAPGDSSPTSKNFTGFPFHPDYNVGLLLFDYILAMRTAKAWTKSQTGLWSKGGVWNSQYIQPKVRWRPPWVEGLTVVGAFLAARAEVDNVAVWLVNTPPDLALGYELDLAVRYDFYGHVHFKLETGVLIPGPALWKDVWPEFDPAAGTVHDGEITGMDAADPVWTIQARLGFEL